MSHPKEDPRHVQVLRQQLKLLAEDIDLLERMASGDHEAFIVSFFQKVLDIEAKTEALLAQTRAIRRAIQ